MTTDEKCRQAEREKASARVRAINARLLVRISREKRSGFGESEMNKTDILRQIYHSLCESEEIEIAEGLNAYNYVCDAIEFYESVKKVQIILARKSGVRIAADSLKS